MITGVINSVVYNGQTYSGSEFGNCSNIVRNMIVYDNGNYYRFIATAVNNGSNPVLQTTSAWERLGNSCPIIVSKPDAKELKEASDVIKRQYKFGEANVSVQRRSRTYGEFCYI